MLQVLKERRSIRKYQERVVEEDKIRTILAAGRMAPSGKNKKPWEFILVDDRDTLQKLAGAKAKGGLFLSNTPAAIVIIGREDISDTWIEDCSIASTFMQLEIHNQDLGSCWVQMKGRFTAEDTDAEDRVREILGLSHEKRVLSVIAMGYPAEEMPPYREEDYY